MTDAPAFSTRQSRLRVPLRVLGLALVGLTLGACSPLDDIMASVFGRSMRDQPSFDPYENTRIPAEGSVPFAAANFPAEQGQVNLGQAEGPTSFPPPFVQFDVVSQAPVVMNLTNPVVADELSLARGEELFLRSCSPCHGAAGDGNGTVTQAGIPPFDLRAEQARAYPDGYIYGIIRVGRGLMPAYGHQLTEFDRWHIVNYVRQLQGGGSVAGSDAGADAPAGSQ
ncbi:MAG: cytochrome c [Gemmatimonadota bacterium]